jgi:hypothetical protein
MWSMSAKRLIRKAFELRKPKNWTCSNEAGTLRNTILGGEGGIRTHGTVARTPDFESGTFDHSATSPGSSTRARQSVPSE